MLTGGRWEKAGEVWRPVGGAEAETARLVDRGQERGWVAETSRKRYGARRQVGHFRAGNED